MTMHKYRSPDSSKTIRVVTDTGHVARVGAEWKQLPAIYHNAAIAAGCECDTKTVAKNDEKPSASPTAVKDRSKAEKIEVALKAMLERDQEGDFKADGNPNLNVVASLAAVRVKNAEVQPIFDRLKKEAEESGGDDDGGDGSDDAGNGD